MSISADLVKELRERTGAGVLDCKKALEKTGGDLEKAIEELRKMGLAKADKKLDRETKEGIVEAYIHPGARLGVLVEVNCETDFVANTEEFRKLAHNIALQIAAMAPKYIKREDIPQDVVEKEKQILKEQLIREGKPENVVNKIVEGKMEKFYQENVLYDQELFMEPGITIEEYLKQHIARFSENIRIKRFARFKIGEE
ncbi:MAG TPA: translation elongation factor Ts [Candidatus Hydrothermia bacterium]|nr:translation elongation factor Ts [Candidatus Hydrothermae bacterium]MDD3649181.1 translation elongation factor Ts [Candidatus Hydrothermia bacterium]MDD5572440.1 translation elongation factor Ts [Candidatus Hydrothermia bacterium]HOK23377.1 translation elongation factor Ts [Candidatus Hydrothermia bacterium]HOL24187.1 translation elongation factor Ts [Candidatus Hydrothermia bacterium]